MTVYPTPAFRPVIGPGYCAQYQALYDEFTNKPSDADAIIQNSRMLARVTGGIYAKSEFDFNFSIHTNAGGEAQLDWIDPVNNPPCTNVNGCAWTAYQGFTGDYAASKCINLNFKPLTDGILINQNSICAIIGVGTDFGTDQFDFGASWFGIRSKNNINLTRFYSLNWTAVDIANINGKKYYAMSRGAADNYDSYINLVKQNNIRTSGALQNGDLYSCGYAGVGAGRQHRFVSLFSYLTEAEVTGNMTDEETYLTNYGTQLIP